MTLKPLWAVWGRSHGLCWRSWAALGAYVGGLGLLLGLLWEVLDRSWDLRGRSWLAIGASVGGPGSLSGPLWAVLARYRGLRGRSWAALFAFQEAKDAIFSEKLALSEKCLFPPREHEK